MGSFRVPVAGTVTISAVETVSPAVPVPNNLTSARIELTSCPEWSSSSGWFAFGVERSDDGGVTWKPVSDQGYTDPHALPIGPVGKGGAMANLNVDWGGGVMTATHVRMKAKTDGAVLTCVFTVTTTP